MVFPSNPTVYLFFEKINLEDAPSFVTETNWIMSSSCKWTPPLLTCTYPVLGPITIIVSYNYTTESGKESLMAYALPYSDQVAITQHHKKLNKIIIQHLKISYHYNYIASKNQIQLLCKKSITIMVLPKINCSNS